MKLGCSQVWVELQTVLKHLKGSGRVVKLQLAHCFQIELLCLVLLCTDSGAEGEQQYDDVQFSHNGDGSDGADEADEADRADGADGTNGTNMANGSDGANEANKKLFASMSKATGTAFGCVEFFDGVPFHLLVTGYDHLRNAFSIVDDKWLL